MAQPQPGPPQGYGQPGPPPGYGQPAYPPNPGPPPAYAHPAQPAYGTSVGATVVVTQPMVGVSISTFRESPIRTQCPHCNCDCVTATTYTTGTFAWVVCLILCFVGCDLGCCFIPFCINSCKDVIHTCPNCKQQLGVYRRM